MTVTRVLKEGVLYQEGSVIIIAFFVDHAAFIDAAFGFRLDYHRHFVIISGHTRYCDNLIKYAKDMEDLIHEVAKAKYEVTKKIGFG